MLSQYAADRVERIDIDYLRTRVGELAQVEGNPHGAAVRHIEEGSAFLVEELPNPLFNHVMGLTASTAGVLPDLAGWYAGYGKPLRVDVTPSQGSPDLFSALTGSGLSQVGFYAGLYAEDPFTAPTVQDQTVHVEVCEPDEFTQNYVAGFGFPSSNQPAMTMSMLVMAGRQDTQFYRARIGTRTVGVGLLFLCDQVGYLATATTLADFRGRGVQGALIRHRIKAAADAGCDLVVGHTAAGSASQRTMERAGLRLAYTKAIWRTPAVAGPRG